MKLLLDQNLSWKLVEQLDEFYPGTAHISSVLPVSADDNDIWSYAETNGFALVTKDNDFEQRSVLFGHPPKVICIRLGNCRTADVAKLLSTSHRIILAFGADEEKSYLPLP